MITVLLDPERAGRPGTGRPGRAGKAGGTLLSAEDPAGPAPPATAAVFCMELLSGLIVCNDVDDAFVDPVAWWRILTNPSSTDDEMGDRDPAGGHPWEMRWRKRGNQADV
ncbi:hypothetical protein QFC19_005140 [Naganishia cerealis]|uniref:Uncharacterized protein n=1 Tax=Naganishia cerealis TaxID=610337 RepID=A0ACC2VR48_9TREE|nr:hypothetical protein QFC19_005140 [Naganishia cerealis]